MQAPPPPQQGQQRGRRGRSRHSRRLSVAESRAAGLLQLQPEPLPPRFALLHASCPLALAAGLPFIHFHFFDVCSGLLLRFLEAWLSEHLVCT